MTTQALPSSHIFGDDIASPAVASARSRKRSMMRRLYDAIIESQMRRAQIEIDRRIGPGGAFEHAFRTKLPPQA